MATNIPSLVFISEKPDEAEQVTLTLSHSTEIISGTWGYEQRSRRREKPRFTLDYTSRFTTQSQIARRRAASEIELLAKVVFPIWPIKYTATLASGVLTLSYNKAYFRENGWVLLETQAGTMSFFEITELGNGTITIDEPPLDGTYTVYPAVLGEKSDDSFAQTETSLNARSERLTLIER